jgi:branched-subunit amino acid aminotransferase/4-amino-4-deoxychorismate lyase
MTIAPQVLLDGELLPAAQARVSALADGFMFGHGVFETVRTRAGRPLHLAGHHARLTASCAALGLTPPTPVEELATRIGRLLAAVRLPAAAVKIVRYQELNRCAELITARPLPYSATDYLRGFRLQTYRQGERDGRLTSHKSLNYLENLLAKKSAREAGFDEALFVTPTGRVLEGATSSLFIVKAGRALTPPLSAGILPGVMRAAVLELIGAERATEADLTLDDVRAANEVFLTNALLGVMPVCALDDHKYPAGSSPETTALRHRLAQIEA